MHEKNSDSVNYAVVSIKLHDDLEAALEKNYFVLENIRDTAECIPTGKIYKNLNNGGNFDETN